MNSPMEDRLRQALAEAGKTIDPGTLQPLRASERRRLRVDFRMVAAAAAVVVVGSGAAVMVSGGAGDDDRMVAAATAITREKADLVVALCTATAPKDTRCEGAVDPEQREGVERVLAELEPQIAISQWASAESTYDDFRTRFADNQAILEAVKATDMPQSFLLKLREGADRRQVMASFVGVPGVMSVIDRASNPYAAGHPPEEEKTDVSVFLCKTGTQLPGCGAKRVDNKDGDPKIPAHGKGITGAQTRALEKLIGKMPEVEKYVFEDQASAYQKFVESFKDNKALVNATSPEDMPESFRIMLKDGSLWREVVEELQRQPGVAQVMANGCMVNAAVLTTEFAVEIPKSEACPTNR
ncbi:permease-like cell division protein FtsX [Nonomuraea sp. NPDC050404]|uniref:permease-like cell division protein FtsX n=1 Tax=Nonomuraea sp. NPDC050404 TaxID=3155783 RepID=UPI0033F47976